LRIDADFTRRGDLRGPDNAFDLVFLEKEFDAFGKIGHRLVFVGHHGLQIDRKPLRDDSHFSEMLIGVSEKLARMQKRFRRDAADIKTGAAKRAALVDACGFKAQLACANGAIIASGSTPDDHNIELISHWNLL